MKRTPTTKGFAAVASIIRQDPPGLPDELVWLLPLGVLRLAGLWIEPDDREKKAAQPEIRFRVTESLYSTRSRFYFLHTQCGADYDLTILSESEAMAWADKRSVANASKLRLPEKKNGVRPGYKACIQCEKPKPPWKYSYCSAGEYGLDDCCKSCRENIRANQQLEQRVHGTHMQLITAGN